MRICSQTSITSKSAIYLGKWLLLASALLGLTACQSFTKFNEDSKSKLGKVLKPYRPDMVQGNFISKEQLERLKLGMDREEVKVILGTPLITSVMHPNRWDYVFAFKRGDTQLVEQRQVTLLFEKDILKKITADDLPTEYELIAEIDGIKASRRVQRKAVAPELESQHAAPTVQTVPNPTQGVGIPRGDTRN
ncbi:outer membrane protein assembly factor BamE [Polynucleobacter sp. AM-26B4]|uniref:outer membrane protein assembly factor BamE n=1 Tax=Polynucleobacter sp. AM-26B4 TaxID=2689103 RepID=UPI001C0D1BD4|nr:outer membrane protein assembly factor BamE [Polynucleobacter sp. AM-26B4]MBU3585166.1 outer membrane protein assembly factor BamE [Polynucleobacter sp. AM-26B4]